MVGSVLAILAALWIWAPVLTISDTGAACRPSGDDPSRGRVTAATGRIYRWSESRAFPPGRVCRVYAYGGTFPKNADQTLIAEKTYPEGAKYGWVVLAFAAPFLLSGAYRRVRLTRPGDQP